MVAVSVWPSNNDDAGFLLELAAGVPAWERDGLCVEYPDTDWFPRKGASAEPAKAVCRRCLVQAECLSFAMNENISEGIWGGAAPNERKLLRSQ